MQKPFLLSASLVVALAIPGCGKDDDAAVEPVVDTPVEPAPATEPAEAPPPDASSDAEAGDDQQHASERLSLGMNKVHSLEVTAVQIGEVPPGGEGTLEVKLSDSARGAVIVRIWIGDEQATGVVKSKMDYNPLRDDYDAHAEAPEDLEGAQWWVEIEPPDAEKMSTPFPIGKKE